MSSYTTENMLVKHKKKCGEDTITTIKTSNESHIYWKTHFHKNPFQNILGLMQILKLIMKLIILVRVMEELIFINKIQYLMVII